MSTLATKYFGTLPFTPNDLITFPRGLPGFPAEQQFLLVEQPTAKPFVFLQSARSPSLCFVTLPVAQLAPDYPLQLTDSDRTDLALPDSEDDNLVRLAITAFEPGESPTANLLAPILVHPGRRLGIQSIQLESGYSHREPLSGWEG